MTRAEQVLRSPGALGAPVTAIGSAAVLALALVWLVAVPIGPEVCAASLPGPRNCFISDRVQAAVLPTLVTVAIAVLSLVVIARPSKRRSITVISVIVLLVVALASYVLVAWIPALAWSWRPDIAP